jgi:hypothetical protein
MKVYFIVIILALLISLFYEAKTDKQLRWKLFFTFLPLFIFAALRVNFGNDYNDYEIFFNEFHTDGPFIFDEDAHAEIGYQFLCYIMPSYRSILVLNAFLLCLALSVFIYRNIPQKYLWLAVLLIFLNPEKNIYGNLVGIRNGMAVIGFILGTVFIQNRKLIPFAFVTTLSLTFHTASILYMPLAYIVGRNTKISIKEIWVWIGVISVLLAFSVSGWIQIASPIISQYLDRYEEYIEEMEAHRGVLLTGASLALTYLIFTLYSKEEKALSKEQRSLVRLGLLYVSSAFLGSLAMRASYFYDMFFIGTVIVLLANSNHNIKGKVLAILAVMMSLYYFNLWFTSPWVYGNPNYFIYTSIFGAW